MNKRAYSVLTIKSMDEEKRVLRGVATTPSTDSYGDIVEPKGAQFDLPVPFLWQHRSDQPIGHVTKATVTDEGIEVEVQIAKIDEAGKLQERVDEAWQSIKAGLVRGLSIGFTSIEHAIIKETYGIHFLKWAWRELSAVTIPANTDASITAIRSIDSELRAASGDPQPNPPPGVSGTQDQPAKRGFFFVPNKGKTVNYQEQIKDLEATKAAAIARMNEIQKAAEGRAKDDAERDEFKDLAAQIKGIDEELADLCELERLNVAKAAPVRGKSSDEGSNSRGPTIIVRKTDADEKFAGQNYTRRVIAKALAYLAQGEASASDIAEQRWGKSCPTLVQVIKAGVAGGTTGTGTGDWGGELVSADSRYTGDFIEYLNSRTIYNQLGLREIPANVTIKGQDGNATGYWVGESQAIPVTKADFFDITLTPLKVAALAVVSNELLRDSSPAAEQLVRDALVEAAAQRTDTTFLSTTAASPGVSPAGILNGVSPGSASGVHEFNLRADIGTLYQSFIAAKNATGLTFVMNPALAKSISLMRNAMGQKEFEGLTQNGGTLEGDPVVTGDNVNAAHLILLKPSDIYKIGDGGVQVSMSREATIEQADDPTGASDIPTAQSKQPVSMFQTESTAIKIVRSINFAKRRSTAVAYIDDAAYKEQFVS